MRPMHEQDREFAYFMRRWRPRRQTHVGPVVAIIVLAVLVLIQCARCDLS